MKIGILSDNHGRIGVVERAAAVFEREAVEAIIHCGDVGRIDSLDPLVGPPIWFVWGNTDLPDPTWRPQAEAIGAHWPDGVPLELELAGRTMTVYHGHEPSFRRGCTSPNSDYLFHGHTHVQTDRRVGASRIVNPGALHRAATKTVAVLDLTRDVLEFHTVERLIDTS